MTKKVSAAIAVVLAVVLAAAGCTGGQAPVARPSAARSAGSPGPSAESSGPAAVPVVLHSGAFGAPVDAEVQPVQVDGDAAVVQVEYSVPKDATIHGWQNVPVGLLLAGAENASWSAGDWGVRLVDLANLTVSPIATDGAGKPLGTTSFDLNLAPGAHVTATSVHAAPQGDVIDVMIPFFGMAQVPVVTAQGAAGKAGLGTPAQARTYPLRSFEQEYDDVMTTRVENRSVTLSLASDVLFDSGQYDLTAQAQQVISDAAAQIKRSADGGEVTAVGHTDDVGSDEFNLTLSQQRAQAVAQQLRAALGAGFTVTAQGRGESDPVALSTSAEARAANRRVELQFAGHQALPVTENQAGTVPAAQVPVASGHDAVQYEPGAGGPMTVSAESVVRQDGVLVGTLRIEQAGASATVQTMLGDLNGGSATGRGFDLVDRMVGAQEVALLGATGRTFPFDYETGMANGQPRRRLLADEMVNTGMREQGDAVLVTVVWPDTGGQTVTIEANKRFRLTDVPVTDVP